MKLTLSQRMRRAAETRFKIAIFDEDGRHSVKQDVLDAADLIELIERAPYGTIRALRMLAETSGKMNKGHFCNRGDCERKSYGAEPCTDCPFCDEKGNL